MQTEAFTHSKLSHREALTQRSFYTQRLLRTANFHTQQAFTQKSFCTLKESPNTEKHLHRGAFTHGSLYTQKLSHTASFHTESFYTEQAFTQRSRYTEKHLHREAFTHSKLLHTEAFAHSQLLHREDFSREAFTLRYTEKNTGRRFYIKQALKLRESADKSLSQPWCSHTNMIYDVQLQKTIALRTQPRRRGAKQLWRIHYNSICNDWVAKHDRTTRKNVGKTTPELAVPMRGRSDHDPGLNERVPHPHAGQASPSIFRGHVLSCKTQHVVHPLSLKTAFRARPPQNPKVEDTKTKLSCETAFKIWKWKMWKRSSRARLPSKSESRRCENEPFLRALSWLRDLLAVRSLGCEISWLWDLLAVKSFGCEISWLWDLLAMRSLGCEISWLWDLLAVRSLGCETSWLWDPLGCEISWLWDPLAVRSLGWEIFWLWDLVVANRCSKMRNSEVRPSNFLW